MAGVKAGCVHLCRVACVCHAPVHWCWPRGNASVSLKSLHDWRVPMWCDVVVRFTAETSSSVGHFVDLCPWRREPCGMTLVQSYQHGRLDSPVNEQAASANSWLLYTEIDLLTCLSDVRTAWLASWFRVIWTTNQLGDNQLDDVFRSTGRHDLDYVGDSQGRLSPNNHAAFPSPSFPLFLFSPFSLPPST